MLAGPLRHIARLVLLPHLRHAGADGEGGLKGSVKPVVWLGRLLSIRLGA